MGVIPRSIIQTFETIKKYSRMKNRIYKVYLSYLQIYNEKIYDLLNSESSKSLRIRWNKKDQFSVENLFVFECQNAQEALQLFHNGIKNKYMATHKLNAQSSRSHCILTLRVDSMTAEDPDNIISSKMQLVDLAGSERASQSGVEGQNLKEAIEINKSLFTLRQVISSLAEYFQDSNTKKSIPFVPYRDSKLTCLLKQSIGGNSYCLMIACLSPCDLFFEENISTLNYASQAGFISNQPVRNEDPRIKQINILKAKNSELIKELHKANEHIAFLSSLTNQNIKAFGQKDLNEKIQSPSGNKIMKIDQQFINNENKNRGLCSPSQMRRSLNVQKINTFLDNENFNVNLKDFNLDEQQQINFKFGVLNKNRDSILQPLNPNSPFRHRPQTTQSFIGQVSPVQNLQTIKGFGESAQKLNGETSFNKIDQENRLSFPIQRNIQSQLSQSINGFQQLNEQLYPLAQSISSNHNSNGQAVSGLHYGFGLNTMGQDFAIKRLIDSVNMIRELLQSNTEMREVIDLMNSEKENFNAELNIISKELIQLIDEYYKIFSILQYLIIQKDSICQINNLCYYFNILYFQIFFAYIVYSSFVYLITIFNANNIKKQLQNENQDLREKLEIVENFSNQSTCDLSNDINTDYKRQRLYTHEDITSLRRKDIASEILQLRKDKRKLNERIKQLEIDNLNLQSKLNPNYTHAEPTRTHLQVAQGPISRNRQLIKSCTPNDGIRQNQYQGVPLQVAQNSSSNNNYTSNNQINSGNYNLTDECNNIQEDVNVQNNKIDSCSEQKTRFVRREQSNQSSKKYLKKNSTRVSLSNNSHLVGQGQHSQVQQWNQQGLGNYQQNQQFQQKQNYLINNNPLIQNNTSSHIPIQSNQQSNLSSQQLHYQACTIPSTSSTSHHNQSDTQTNQSNTNSLTENDCPSIPPNIYQYKRQYSREPQPLNQNNNHIHQYNVNSSMNFVSSSNVPRTAFVIKEAKQEEFLQQVNLNKHFHSSMSSGVCSSSSSSCGYQMSNSNVRNNSNNMNCTENLPPQKSPRRIQKQSETTSNWRSKTPKNIRQRSVTGPKKPPRAQEDSLQYKVVQQARLMQPGLNMPQLNSDYKTGSNN